MPRRPNRVAALIAASAMTAGLAACTPGDEPVAEPAPAASAPSAETVDAAPPPLVVELDSVPIPFPEFPGAPT
ncbi:MAG: hypothetical protein EAS51_04950 [Microbacteriaceae bacterium]|nr:MAG: hypothetical protein EAS51_04950 [Microbacteriaceae bacterium]